jgi:serine/threonine-protein kinase
VDAHFVELQTALAGRYSLERELGRGGMSVVYLAHEVALDRPVALKLLPPGSTGTEGVRERFIREARTAAKLSHPHIVPIFAVDQVDDFVFFAMAAIDGETLGERVRSRGPLTNADATRLVKELSWALAYAHAQGVVHRDIKPDNILLEHGTGRALVTDFGIADLGAEGQLDAVSQVLGTAEFMSPEQARGAPVDARSDLYSLAAVGFFAVSGRAPFEGSSPAAILGRHVAEPAPRLASVVPGVSPSLAGVIDRCLRKDPEHRLLGGESVADALAHEAIVERQLPVPLRVFIRNLREMSRSVSGLGVVSVVLLLPMLVGLVMSTGASGFVVGAGFVAFWLAAVGATAAWHARKVVKAGFTLEETRLALLEDVNRRNEEIRFDVGPRTTPLDTLLDRIAVGALSVSLLALLAIGVAGIDAPAVWQVFGVGLFGGMGAGLVRAVRRGRRADLVGERWLRIWGGRAGDWLFKLASLGLDPPTSLPAGAHRSTEVALGLAAVRLFDELPRETRRELGDLPATVRRLEGDARVLRAQVRELDAVLDELGEDPSAAGAGARDTVRREVGATRDEAARRLRDVVAALETIRVGLLRMHAGESIVHSVTMELDAARAISGDMEDLLVGHREVERLLAERRATGAFEIAELPDTFPAEDGR